MRIIASTAAAVIVSAAAISAANAHIALEQPSAAPGFYKAVLKLPHGCDGKATTGLSVTLPEGFIDAKPMPKPGWEIELTEGDYKKAYELHGKPVSSGLTAVNFSGGTLPDAYYDEFVIVGTLAGVEPGQTLYFDTVQSCGEETVSWTDRPTGGEAGHHPEHPAPALEIADGSGGGHMDHMNMGGMHTMSGMKPQAGRAHDAETVKAGEITVSRPWIKAMLPGQKIGGGYLVIANGGKAADHLVSIASPLAEAVEIHEMSMANDVMKMRKVEGGLAVPAGKTVALEPGGYHLMFKGMKQPFEAGEIVPVTLTFEKAGAVALRIPVLPANTRSYEDGAKKAGGN